MPRIANLYFRTAIIFLIIGICIGIRMAVTRDHSVIPAHAHANLLGWVTMAIFGIYYALNPEKAQRRIAMVQYAIYTSGVALMIPSLYFLLMGHMAVGPLVSIATLLTFAGVLIFAYIIFSVEPSPRTAPAE